VLIPSQLVNHSGKLLKQIQLEIQLSYEKKWHKTPLIGDWCKWQSFQAGLANSKKSKMIYCNQVLLFENLYFLLKGLQRSKLVKG